MYKMKEEEKSLKYTIFAFKFLYLTEFVLHRRSLYIRYVDREKKLGIFKSVYNSIEADIKDL